MNQRTDPPATRADVFTVRALMELTGIVSLSTIRRGLEGLVSKFSVEREAKAKAILLGSDFGLESMPDGQTNGRA